MRGLNALQLALGAVGGGISGYQTAQARRLEEERLKRAEARQTELDKLTQEQQLFSRASALTGMGFRPTEVRTAPDEAAKSVTALAMPEIPTTMGETPLRSALGRATQAGMGVSGKPTGMLDTPVSLALDTTKRQQFERGAAMQAANPEMQMNLPGVGRVGFAAPLSEAEKSRQRMEEYRGQLGVQQEFKTQEAAREAAGQEQKVARLADLYVKTYTDASGRPISRDMAMAAAMQGKTPMDMGFSERPMSNQDRVRLALDMQRLNLSEREYALKLREQDRRESDSQRRRETMPAGAQRRLEGLDGGVLLVGDVRETLKTTPDAIGPVKGRMLGSVVDAMDQQGVGVRAAIEAMSGEIRNQRFGGALSTNEAKFAERFLPDAKDSYETAISKLDQLEKFLETKRKGVFMTYQQPYRPIYTGDAPPSAGGAANPYR